VSSDALWALVNVGVALVMLAAYGLVFWLNARANRRQAERLARRYGWNPDT
jgi:hypothetical protein